MKIDRIRQEGIIDMSQVDMEYHEGGSSTFGPRMRKESKVARHVSWEK